MVHIVRSVSLTHLSLEGGGRKSCCKLWQVLSLSSLSTVLWQNNGSHDTGNCRRRAIHFKVFNQSGALMYHGSNEDTAIAMKTSLEDLEERRARQARDWQ